MPHDPCPACNDTGWVPIVGHPYIHSVICTACTASLRLHREVLPIADTSKEGGR